MSISRNLSFLAEGVSSTGVLGATYGGTGQSSITTGDLLYGSASNTISKLAIGSTGTVLRVVAGVPSWGTDYTGTVTSVAATVPSFLSISGSPITTSGTLAITYSGTALPTANGGTALTSFTANGVLYASSSSVLTTGSTLQFDGSNLGINITPSAWGTNLKGLEFGRLGSAIYANKTNGNVNLVTNWLNNGTNTVYVNNGYAAGYQILTTTGSHIWLVAPSGTAGGTITTTQAMTLFTSGGLSIGNTTDPSANNLSVTGTGKYGTTIGVGAATPATSGAGVTFPATQSDSTDVNTLDDYEEGTWTPTQGSGLTVVGAFSSTGYYTKIGNTVNFWGSVSGATSIACTSGGLLTSGLPFTSGSVPAVASLSNSNATAGAQAQISVITLYSFPAIAATTAIYFSGTYRN